MAPRTVSEKQRSGPAQWGCEGAEDGGQGQTHAGGGGGQWGSEEGWKLDPEAKCNRWEWECPNENKQN